MKTVIYANENRHKVKAYEFPVTDDYNFYTKDDGTIRTLLGRDLIAKIVMNCLTNAVLFGLIWVTLRCIFQPGFSGYFFGHIMGNALLWPLFFLPELGKLLGG